MIYDCHLHTAFSGDCTAPAKSQIEKAIGLGMREICITDHHDYDTAFCEDNFLLDVPAYLPALKKLQEEYEGRIRVNIGIELGLLSHLNHYLHTFAEQYGGSFDFVIGSSHFVEGRDPYSPEYWKEYGRERGLEAYFKTSLKRVQQLYDVFDSFGHLDYAARYVPGPRAGLDEEQTALWVDPILRLLIEHGKGLECNTCGFRYGMGQPNPSAGILKRYRGMGGELVTVGSDAHRPEDIGFEFVRCQKLLQECGFKYYTVFHDRKPVFIPL